MEYLIAGAALILGAVAGYLIAHFRSGAEQSRLEERISNLSMQLEESEKDRATVKTEGEEKLLQYQTRKEEELHQERERRAVLDRELASLKAEYQALQDKLNEQKGELEDMQAQFKMQFENLANKIFEEKSEKFTKQNRENLDQLLKPLGENLESFKKKVEDTYNEENKDRATLKEQIRQMSELNEKMREDAKNLTKALKGDSKAQGNWGEVILERILERSGLTKGREYEVQQSATNEEGRRLQPDVVVHLPEEKFLVIDSKVSLTDYERFSSADDEDEASAALKRHVNSIRTHVKGLSAKNYQQIHGDRSPDFVLLFVPIEPAFAAALQADGNLYYEAFDQNIVIVSPSTLLATLATISSVWKQEYRNENVREIAKRGGALYDKFILFLESMDEIGTRIRQTQSSYEEAVQRLSKGRGNVIRQVEMLKEMKVESTKQLPDSFRNFDDGE
tara:strand:- start:254 stop:1603 length:1350 start_codon:yes stop_codon:yes gene_type:complete